MGNKLKKKRKQLHLMQIMNGMRKQSEKGKTVLYLE